MSTVVFSSEQAIADAWQNALPEMSMSEKAVAEFACSRFAALQMLVSEPTFNPNDFVEKYGAYPGLSFDIVQQRVKLVFHELPIAATERAANNAFVGIANACNKKNQSTSWFFQPAFVGAVEISNVSVVQTLIYEVDLSQRFGRSQMTLFQLAEAIALDAASLHGGEEWHYTEEGRRARRAQKIVQIFKKHAEVMAEDEAAMGLLGLADRA
jgi:hypothetical protein